MTLIANLLLMVMQKRIRRSWSFSNLATMFRIMLMYYVNCYTFFEQPEKDWLKKIEANSRPPDNRHFSIRRGLTFQNSKPHRLFMGDAEDNYCKSEF